MYCTECGEKLTLMFANGEGLVPYCKNCKEYRFAQFPTAVSMVVTNRTKDNIKGMTIIFYLQDILKKEKPQKKRLLASLKRKLNLTP